MATLPTLINNFSRGMTNSPRNEDLSFARVVQHFDNHTDPNRLIPYRSSETGDSSASIFKIENFLYTGATLYGIGVVTGTAKPQIFSKTDFSNATWTSLADNSGTTGTVNTNLFVYYGKTGKIYGAKGGNTIYSYDLAGSSWNNSEHSLSYTTLAQGIVHTDSFLYVPYDNKIAINNNGSWTDAALTLPSNMTIVSICSHNNLIAIAAKSKDAGGKSIVYLWDGDSSVEDVIEAIDWGNEEINTIESLEGVLVGVSLAGNSAVGLTPKVVLKQYTSGGAVPFLELTASDTSIVLNASKQKVGNKLYFPMSITLNGTLYQGIWKLGRPTAGQPFALTFDRLPNNNTALTSGLLNGFCLLGDYMFISYQSGGSYAMSKTDDQVAYTATSAYETVIFNAIPGLRNRRIPDSSVLKKLVGITATFEPLPSGATVVLKYKKDEESAWTQIFSYASTNSLSHSALNIESTGGNLPEHKEIQFRVESTGGAVITSLKFHVEVVDNDLY